MLLIKASILHREIGVTLHHKVHDSRLDSYNEIMALSPLLFNMALEKVDRESDTLELGIRLGNRRLGALAYADDVVLSGEDEKSSIEQKAY